MLLIEENTKINENAFNLYSLKFSSSKEIKTYYELVKDYNNFIISNLQNKMNNNIYKSFVIIPLINNKYIGFVCENLDNLNDTNTAIFDFLNDSFKTRKDDIQIDKNSSELIKLKGILQDHLNFNKIISLNFPLSNKSFFIFGIITFDNNDQNIDVFKFLLKLYRNNFQIFNSSKNYCFSKEMFELMQSKTILEFYDLYFKKLSIYEKLDIKVLKKKGKTNFKDILVHKFPTKHVSDFKYFSPRIYMKKNDDINIKSLFNENVLKEVFNENINPNENCIFDDKSIIDILNLDFKEKDQWNRVLMFEIQISETTQIIICLVNIHKFKGDYEDVNEEVKHFTENYLNCKHCSFEKRIAILEKICLRRLIKEGILETKLFGLRRNKIASIFEKMNQLIKRKINVNLMEKLKIIAISKKQFFPLLNEIYSF